MGNPERTENGFATPQLVSSLSSPVDKIVRLLNLVDSLPEPHPASPIYGEPHDGPPQWPTKHHATPADWYPSSGPTSRSPIWLPALHTHDGESYAWT